MRILWRHSRPSKQQIAPRSSTFRMIATWPSPTTRAGGMCRSPKSASCPPCRLLMLSGPPCRHRNGISWSNKSGEAIDRNVQHIVLTTKETDKMYRLHGGDTMIENGQLLNYIGGKWQRSRASEYQDVRNPATAETMVRVPLSPADEVNEAVQAAQVAFPDWRRTPPGQRIQYLFKLKKLLDDHFDEIARLTVNECGKTMEESRGELRRGIENVEVATGITTLMQGYNSEDIAHGIDEHMFRQPVGVVAAITPFNFPGMIPLWYLPYALACGNCFILKPSEKVPMTMSRVFDLLDELGLLPEVVSLLNGAKVLVDALLDTQLLQDICFVGSSVVAEY